MGGGGGGKDGDSEVTVRYAPYLEVIHSDYINAAGHEMPNRSMTDSYNDALNNSPYADYVEVDPDKGFFGYRTDDPTVLYQIENFPSLWDIFGKFMAGLDVHDLWAEVYEDVVHGPEIENEVAAQSEMLQDEIDTNVMPRFVAGMRDINAVQSSAFVIGKAIIADSHVKSINKFAADLRMHAIDISNQQWANHLTWSRGVVEVYNTIMGQYYTARQEFDKTNLEYASKDVLWNLSLADYARAMIGALNGAAAATETATKTSQLSKSLGGAIGGAAMGAMSGAGVPGAIIGGLLGLGSSFL